MHSKFYYKLYALVNYFVFCLYQASLDLLKELCNMLNLTDESDIEEFGIFADLGKRKCTIFIVHTCT